MLTLQRKEATRPVGHVARALDWPSGPHPPAPLTPWKSACHPVWPQSQAPQGSSSVISLSLHRRCLLPSAAKPEKLLGFPTTGRGPRGPWGQGWAASKYLVLATQTPVPSSSFTKQLTLIFSAKIVSSLHFKSSLSLRVSSERLPH